MEQKQTKESAWKAPTENGITEENLVSYVKNMIHVLGQPNHTYKDHVFRMLLKDKAVALEIYNAMNDTSYADPDLIQITTLENAVYLGVKNDVSFIIDSRLVLYEHQSTPNPNMPLRDLFYVACIFSSIICDKKLYGSSLISLPSPKFVVFYNGKKDLPERSILRLSDAYAHIDSVDDIALELKVEVININAGNNTSLMDKSPTLMQYATFVDIVRRYEKDYAFAEAMELAIHECINKNILSDFLIQNRAEVMRMCLFEYDQEEHLRVTYQEGEDRGMALANQLTQCLLKDNRIDDLSRSTTDAPFRQQLLQEYHLI